MDKFEAQKAIVVSIRQMSEAMSATWTSESGCADVVAELTSLIVDLRGNLTAAQLALLMTAGSIIYRQAQLAQLRPSEDGKPFDNQRAAAMALLTGGKKLSRKAGSFLGQCVVDTASLTFKQRDWLVRMLEEADLPPLIDGGAQ